jgi:hypothetical protein
MPIRHPAVSSRRYITVLEQEVGPCFRYTLPARARYQRTIRYQTVLECDHVTLVAPYYRPIDGTLAGKIARRDAVCATRSVEPECTLTFDESRYSAIRTTGRQRTI